MIFNEFACDLLIACTGNILDRFSIDEGKFLTSFETGIENVNRICHNPKLDLVIAVGDNGASEIWDYQNLKKLGSKKLLNG